jgi:uncharacterized repeat protein (TIGR03803 family)
VGGTITGLSSGQSVTLLDSGGDALTVSGNVTFSFSTPLPAGSAYNVSVQSTTSGTTCSVSNGSGTVGSANVVNIAVSCGSAIYTIGGAVTGLSSGQTVTLLNDGGDALSVVSNGSFTFATALSAGSAYAVTVQSKTPGIACSVSNATGTVGSSDVTNVGVSCSAGMEAVLYSFGSDPSDGTSPFAGLVMDGDGNLYGTTYQGGASNLGTVFKLSSAGTKTVLYSFGSTTNDGAGPKGTLIMDSTGNLYGTTVGGGASGQGTVFKLSLGGVETVLYSFGSSSTDGSGPYGRMVMDSAGNLYGTTRNGGTYNYGTVFKISPVAVETVLYSFGSTTNDGLEPQAGLVMDKAGNLYGTTAYGGTNSDGTVFRISPGGVETVLHLFGSTTNDGINPEAGLIMDSAGNLYGTTTGGGLTFDQGTVFMLSPSGVETVLYQFNSSGPTDGAVPRAGLVMDSAGNLYGTTNYGGANGEGTVFKLSSSGAETVLYSFLNNSADGVSPVAPLIMDGAGNLYGTTLLGGANNEGTVFKLN